MKFNEARSAVQQHAIKIDLSPYFAGIYKEDYETISEEDGKEIVTFDEAAYLKAVSEISEENQVWIKVRQQGVEDIKILRHFTSKIAVDQPLDDQTEEVMNNFDVVIERTMELLRLGIIDNSFEEEVSNEDIVNLLASDMKLMMLAIEGYSGGSQGNLRKKRLKD